MEFRIGEMAKINNVTIHTLRHYDKIGILKPSHVDDTSGYRYYTLLDCDVLNRIKAYKAMGFSLEKIKALVKGEIHDVEEALVSLSESLSEEKRRIQILESYVEDQLKAIRKIKDKTLITKPEVMKIDSRYGYKINVSEEMSVPKILKAISDFEKKEKGHGEVQFKPTRISHVEGERVVLDHYFAMKRVDDNKGYDVCIQGGNFLVLDYLGDRESIDLTFKRLMDYAIDNDLELEGTVLELLLIPEAIASNESDRITQIQLKLR